MKQTNQQLEGILNERYQLVHKVGEGGMGELYLARDLKLNGALRALKVLKNIDSTQTLWMDQEAYILTRLQHRNLPSIFDFSTLSELDRPYLVMEWIPGIHLGQLLEMKTLALDYIIYVAQEVLEALAYLHSQQPPIIHRDIKPSNIMLAKDGGVKLIDFGISKQLGISKGKTVQFGTRGYSAPEQLMGQTTDERSDIYSFGALLLRMLGMDPSIWLNNGRLDQARIRKLSAFPKALKEIIVDCLQELPQHRPSHVQELIHRFKQLQLADKRNNRQTQQWTQDQAMKVAGQKIAVLSAHPGAGATFIALSISNIYQDYSTPHAYIEHRQDEGELAQRYRDSEMYRHSAVYMDEAIEAANLGSAKYYMVLERAAGDEELIQRTTELAASLALLQDVIVDYSSHWKEQHIEHIVQHADMVVVVNSPWIIQQSSRYMHRLNQLLQQASKQQVQVVWIHNRDQAFQARSAWLQLSGGLPKLQVPELSRKLILNSMWLEQAFPPYQKLTKEMKKYLMPLMKKYVRLQ